MKKQRVITYSHCYTPDMVTLCGACEVKYPYPLGAVNHGLHFGECEGDDCYQADSEEMAVTVYNIPDDY